MKTAIFNLIILDESGSMGNLTKATIDGCNETINTIISSQGEFKDSQEHFVSIYAFQGGTSVPSRYLLREVPAAKAQHINNELYRPWGNTPLYDAIGTTLSDLRETVRHHELAIGSVTIITDGYENSSEKYTHEHVAKMIQALTELGWNFNFIGANIDVDKVAQSLNIENSLNFEASEAGTRNMYASLSDSRAAHSRRIHADMCAAAASGESEESLRARFRKSNSESKLK